MDPHFSPDRHRERGPSFPLTINGRTCNTLLTQWTYGRSARAIAFAAITLTDRIVPRLRQARTAAPPSLGRRTQAIEKEGAEDIQRPGRITMISAGSSIKPPRITALGSWMSRIL